MKREWTPILPRDNDIFLMYYFIINKYNKMGVLLLNQCQQYLQVLTLTDICSTNGKNITAPIYKGQKLIDRRSILNWPEQQQHPNKAAWILWKAALECLAATFISQCPLGTWLSNSHQQWFWYMDPYTSPFPSFKQRGMELPHSTTS